MKLEIALLLLMQLEIIAVGGYVVSQKKPGLGRKPSFVDTSVLMDGRIMAAVDAGFIPSQLVIPESVLAELQLLADGSDSDKRARARHGLDIANLLTEHPRVSTLVLKDGPAKSGVDDQLLLLAKKYKGSICTIDFNLNKVATVSGIDVLNVNELAQQLRMNHLPGERVSIKIMQKGNDTHQGVGYLADGTMVVVEQAKANIDQTVEVEFIRSLQTAAGRMLFAKKVDVQGGLQKQRQSNSLAEKLIKKSDTPTGKKPVQPRRRKPKTNEDNLVELANRPE